VFSPAEIMNTSIRAKATAMTSMSSWIANFMIGQVSPIAFASIGKSWLRFRNWLTLVGWHYYLVFTVCGFTNAIVFFLFFPETRGRTLEEMDVYFRTANPIVPLDKTAHKIDGLDRDQTLREASEQDNISIHYPVADELAVANEQNEEKPVAELMHEEYGRV
jgi:hypothetical protein